MNWTDSLSTLPELAVLFPADEASEPRRNGCALRKVRTGFHIRRAGLGTWAVLTLRDIHHNPAFADYQAWKLDIDEPTTERMAAAIVGTIREWCPNIPRDWTVTTPPAGASRPGPYPAGFLGRAVASMLDLDYLTCIQRDPADKKIRHGRAYTLTQLPFAVPIVPPAAALIVDDFINTGTTMRLSLEALRAAGCPAFGFAWGAA